MGGDERGGETASSSTARAPRQPPRPHLGKYPLSPHPVPVPTPAAGPGGGTVPPAALPGGREGGACMSRAGKRPGLPAPQGAGGSAGTGADARAQRSSLGPTPAGRAPTVRAQSGGICFLCCGGCTCCLRDFQPVVTGCSASFPGTALNCSLCNPATSPCRQEKKRQKKADFDGCSISCTLKRTP